MPTDEIEKIPNPVNKPESGTYGEGAALDRLKGSLPPMAEGPGGPAPVGPPPGPGGGSPQVPLPPPNLGGGGPMAPSGVPEGLLAPTERPQEGILANTQASSPMSFEQPQMSAQQQRLETLIALATSPQVSDETREWAQLWVKTLTEAQV